MENLLILTMLSWFSSGIVFCVFYAGCCYLLLQARLCVCDGDVVKQKKKYIDSSGSAFVGPLYIWKTNGLLNLEHSPNLL